MSTPRELKHSLASIEKLRSIRPGFRAAGTLATPMNQLCQTLRRQSKAVGGLHDTWERLAPPELKGLCRIRGLSKRTITLLVRDSSACFEADRLLRSGLGDQLCRACGAAWIRVEVAQILM
ncbi:MAG: hypothetical protein U0638_09440 [Phycisphaerales bacterium]